MAINFPGPFEIELSFAVQGFTHKARYNCNFTTDPPVGTDPDDIDLITKGGIATPAVSAAMASWVTLLAPFYNIAESFPGYIISKIAPLSFVRTFISAGTLVTIGISANPTIKAQQSIYTFHTAEGNDMRLSLMETVITTNLREPFADLGSSDQALVNFVESDANWILARDTSFPIAFIARNPGQNEAVFKRRFRP